MRPFTERLLAALRTAFADRRAGCFFARALVWLFALLAFLRAPVGVFLVRADFDFFVADFALAFAFAVDLDLAFAVDLDLAFALALVFTLARAFFLTAPALLRLTPRSLVAPLDTTGLDDFAAPFLGGSFFERLVVEV